MLLLPELKVAATMPRRAQVDEELRQLRAFDVEPLPGFEPGTYGLRNRISCQEPGASLRTFNDQPTNHVDPHASSHIFVHEPDRVALALLEAQAAWLGTHDRVKLRRVLLGILARLDE
jgi:hypothetical protein